MPRYPSRAELEELVSNLDKGKGNQAAFLSRVSPNVDWEVMGSFPSFLPEPPLPPPPRQPSSMP